MSIKMKYINLFRVYGRSFSLSILKERHSQPLIQCCCLSTLKRKTPPRPPPYEKIQRQFFQKKINLEIETKSDIYRHLLKGAIRIFVDGAYTSVERFTIEL